MAFGDHKPSHTNTPMTPFTLTWAHNGVTHTAFWHSERGQSAPSRIELADDRISADAAYRLAVQGVGLLWQGDFQNARHLLQALDRRITQRADASVRRKRKGDAALARSSGSGATLAQVFWAQRQAQAHRAQILGCVLMPLQADYSIALRRAPDVRQACTEAWGDAQDTAGPASTDHGPSHVCRLRELLGVVGAHEWRKKGVEIPALGLDRRGHVQRIHAHHGVFSPVRGEYVDLVAQAPLPTVGTPDATADASRLTVWDIGTGTGVLAAVLAQRGVGRVIGTDASPRAVRCAQDNLQRLRDAARKPLCETEVMLADLFPPQGLCDKADLVVCNPPWLPSPAGSALDAAVYDEGGRMLHGFLAGVAERLTAGGQAWLILSDLAERLGLRTPCEVDDAVQAAGLRVIAKQAVKPQHSRSCDTGDALYAARSQEVTSLWCLSHARDHGAQ
jgi:methylase of polypeptide subunit release factors